MEKRFKQFMVSVVVGLEVISQGLEHQGLEPGFECAGLDYNVTCHI